MVFNKLPKEMRRTLALTLAASMVATGTQTPVFADQVQEVSAQEVQNTQTETGEKQNVRAAEQQEEVPVAEEQTGTEESVQKQTLSANEVNPVDPVTDPNGQESKIETQAAEEEEMGIDEFAQYCCKYASEIDCSITGKSMLALYERIEIMEEDGIPLVRKEAEALIEEAADRAEKPSLGKAIKGLFSSKYDKDGMLILKEEHFI